MSLLTCFSAVAAPICWGLRALWALRALPPWARCALVAAGLAAGAAAPAAAQSEDLGGAARVAAEAQPLVLRAAKEGLDAWPFMRMLAEPPDRLLRAQAAWAEQEHFVVPQVPHANLGVQPGAVWLRMAVQLPAGGPADWVFDVDSPTLDELELHLVHNGTIIESHRSGDSVPMAQRPLPSRSLAIPLRLNPGQTYELLVRARNSGTLMMPARLYTPQHLHAREARVELVQGLLAGMGLCLLAYSLLHGAGSRDAMYAYYALTLTGTVMFFLSFHGLGAEHLWPDDLWLVNNAPLLFVLVALSASFLFADRALGMAALWPRWSTATRGMAVACAVVLAGFAVGALSYRFTYLFATLAGVMPMVMAAPLAVQKARRGDLAARYLLISWSVYGLGALTMSMLLHGKLAANGWAPHLFQLSAIFEMVMWMAVLSAHNANMRRAGRAAEQERAKMATLALADPLTGLANRRGLRQQGSVIVAQASPARLAAVFMLDLDNFKPVNDEHGHDVGDKLLAALAQRLCDTVNPAACVARLGGDEFVVVCGGLKLAADAQELALKLQVAVSEPFELRGTACQVGATVGYAMAPHHGMELTQLLQRADAALYAGKRHGRGQVRVARTAAEQQADEEAAAWAAQPAGPKPAPAAEPAPAEAAAVRQRLVAITADMWAAGSK